MSHLDPDLLHHYKLYLRALLTYQSFRRGIFYLSSWLHIKTPSRQRTPHVIASTLFGMTIVLITSLIGASLDRAEFLLAIPLYGIYSMLILVHRQSRLNMQAS